MSRRWRSILPLLCLAGGRPAEAQRLYWRADDHGDPSIYRCNLDGSNVQQVVTGADPGLALDLVEGKLYWSADGLIVRSNLDGSDVETVIHYPYPTLEMALDLLHEKLYWRDSDGVFWTKLDGSDARNVLYDGVFCICGFALDPPNDTMYWLVSDSAFQGLIKGDLEGDNPQQLITEGLVFPRSLALDPVTEKLYFLDGRSTGPIYRANTDGSGKELVLDWPEVLIGVRLAVAPVHRKLYWTDRQNPAIHRANLDGSAPEYVVYMENLSHGPSSVAIDPRVPGDCDVDLVVDAGDMVEFIGCRMGPEEPMELGCACADADGDGRVDLSDFSALQNSFSVP